MNAHFKGADSLTADRVKRVLQIVAIIIMCFIAVVILDKGATDISLLRQNCPDDFWRALAQYLIGNMAGGGRFQGLNCNV